MEVADFVAGWGAVDLLNEDFAGTRGLRLEGGEERRLELLGEHQRSEETMERFGEAREAGGTGGAGG